MMGGTLSVFPRTDARHVTLSGPLALGFEHQLSSSVGCRQRDGGESDSCSGAVSRSRLHHRSTFSCTHGSGLSIRTDRTRFSFSTVVSGSWRRSTSPARIVVHPSTLTHDSLVERLFVPFLRGIRPIVPARTSVEQHALRRSGAQTRYRRVCIRGCSTA